MYLEMNAEIDYPWQKVKIMSGTAAILEKRPNHAILIAPLIKNWLALKC